MENDRRRYMNFRQLAERLDTTPGSLKATYQRHGIPHIRLGRRVLFDVEDTDRWLASMKMNMPATGDAELPAGETSSMEEREQRTTDDTVE